MRGGGKKWGFRTFGEEEEEIIGIGGGRGGIVQDLGTVEFSRDGKEGIKGQLLI